MLKTYTKAESLLFLKSIGFSPEPLLIINKLLDRKTFFVKLKQAGFHDGQEIGVRFSYTGIMEVPRSMGLCSFDEVYGFIKKYFRKRSAAIIHPFIKASYVGTLYFFPHKNEMLINLVKSGIWEPSIAKNCDIFLIGEKKAIVYRYKKQRIIYVPSGKKLMRKTIKPLTQKEIDYLIGIFLDYKPVLRKIKKFKDRILEFIITPGGKFVAMELEHIGKGIKYLPKKKLNLFKVKKYEDIADWDGQKDLLLTLTVYRADKEKFLRLINNIKPYKKEVFVEYGLLSHPAILLRENGITTNPCISDYEVLTFKF